MNTDCLPPVCRRPPSARAAEASWFRDPRFQLLLEAAEDCALMSLDPEGHVNHWDLSAERLLGLTAQEVMGSHFSRFYRPEDRERNLPARELKAALSDGPSLEVWQLANGDTPILVRVLTRPLRDADDVCAGYCRLIRDLSERRRADENIRIYTDLVQGMPIGLYALRLENRADDRTLRIVSTNLVADQLTGRAIEEVLGSPLDDVLPGLRQYGVPQACAAVVQSGQPANIGEIELAPPQGPPRHCFVKAFPLPNQCVGIVLEDVTERKRSLEQIQEQAALLDVAREAISVLDLDHRLVYWNKRAELLYGWCRDGARLRHLDELFPQTEAQPPRTALASLPVTGQWTGELHQLCPDGRRLIVDSAWTVVRHKDGRPKSILVVNTDITERKKLEAQFLRAQRLESIGTLASGVAHDLNNALAPIAISLELLRNDLGTQERTRLLGILAASTQRAADMVKQLLTFARGIEGQRVSIQLNHLLRELKKILSQTLPKSIRIVLDAPANLWFVNGDATQLHQVMMNLCVNARDAMPQGGTLTLAAQNQALDESYAAMNPEARPGAYVVVQVTDTGTGIPPEVLDKIFEPFFTTKKVGHGTGLGLSTALGIVKSHGGFINVRSEPGKGTQFALFLPAKETAEPGEGEKGITGLPRSQGETILVVDDDHAVLEVTARTLEQFGYHVLRAADGTQAATLYAKRTEPIALVLTDMMMPVMDGATTIRILQKLDPTVRIVAASGLLSQKTEAERLGANVRAFLLKPFNADLLLKTIHDALVATQLGG